jgi:hypothetical protein
MERRLSRSQLNQTSCCTQIDGNRSMERKLSRSQLNQTSCCIQIDGNRFLTTLKKKKKKAIYIYATILK